LLHFQQVLHYINIETVYGLGANALDSNAVENIYKAKERPLTDPVICHVLDFEEAKKLIDISKNIETIYLGYFKFNFRINKKILAWTINYCN
jgi:tRNA A37 threonylcarbamoyladenosine synthetase subunit TsaC/SUA5/YrdC